jgi:hypothetical protein
MARQGMNVRRVLNVVLLAFVLGTVGSRAVAQSKILIPMDLKQTDHLKAYGIAFWVLQHSGEVDWLLNYRGGSFMTDYSDVLARECRIRNDWKSRRR